MLPVRCSNARRNISLYVPAYILFWCLLHVCYSAIYCTTIVLCVEGHKPFTRVLTSRCNSPNQSCLIELQSWCNIYQHNYVRKNTGFSGSAIPSSSNTCCKFQCLDRPIPTIVLSTDSSSWDCSLMVSVNILCNTATVSHSLVPFTIL